MRTPGHRLIARRLLVAALCCLGLALAAPAARAGAMPEDILKGTMIISDRSIPTKWSSAGAYASQLKGLNKQSVFYDKKTGKVTVYYAAFFAQPVNDVQVNFVIYDVTSGPRVKKGSWEAFMGRKGERVLFNSVELDKEDIEMNKKYLFAIELKNKIIASNTLILRGEAPKYSGKVDFSEDEAKGKK